MDWGGANSRFLGLVSVWAARSFDQTALRPSVIKRIRQIDVKYITHITSFGVTAWTRVTAWTCMCELPRCIVHWTRISMYIGYWTLNNYYYYYYTAEIREFFHMVKCGFVYIYVLLHGHCRVRLGHHLCLFYVDLETKLWWCKGYWYWLLIWCYKAFWVLELIFHMRLIHFLHAIGFALKCFLFF